MTAATEEATEQQLQEDLARLEAYRAQLNAMLQQYQYLSSSRLDHLRARQALEGLDRSSAGTELLIPLGGETFLRGSAVLESPVFLGIGSGVVVEMERPKVAEVLSQRLLKIEEASQELEANIQTLEERIQRPSQRLDALPRGGGSGEPPLSSDVGGD